jgi:APA family basic amino acid/polyamine antiporter
MVILLIYKPNYTFPGLGIVLLGIPVFYLWRKFGKKPVAES